MKDGGPAFHSITCRAGDNYNAPTLIYHRGMSLRDWFAGQALPVVDSRSHGTPLDIATECYQLADAMIEAREKEGK